MSANRFARLFNPQTIAVIGGRDAEAVIKQCHKLGFDGEIWPVNQRRKMLGGVPCYQNLADLPAPPDAAFVAVNAEMAIGVVKQLAEAGAGGAIIYAAGFNEAGEVGGDRQARLVAAAGSMPILGPNCYGVVNATARAALWPDEHGLKPCSEGIAFISQSGNIAINVSMQQRGLPVSHLVALGNQAQTGISSVIEALAADPTVTGFGLYLETIGDPADFTRAALAAHNEAKPIVAIKAGRSEQGAATAFTHTASLAGEDAVVDAFLRRLGVLRVGSLGSLVECLKLLSIHGQLAGNNLITLSCSGGEAAMMADLATAFDVRFEPIPVEHHAAIKATLNEYVHLTNPFDYHTFIWHDHERLEACYEAVLQSRYDLALLILDLPRADRCDLSAWQAPLDAFVRAAMAVGAPAGVVTSLGESLPEATADRLIAQGIVPFCGFERALEAVSLAARKNLIADTPITGVRVAADTVKLDEWRAKRLFRSIGIPAPAGHLCHSAAEAIAASEHLGFPVALKAAGTEIAHKSEMGAVVLNLQNADQLAAAAERLLSISPAVLLERMVTNAVCEILIGLNNDPVLGPYLVIASGGIMTEIIDDAQTLLLPLVDHELDEALAKLQIWPLIQGFRGRPAADLAALKATVHKLADAAMDDRIGLVE